MNKKSVAISCLVAVVISTLCGCTLAKEGSGPEGAGADRMIGVVITTEYLDLFDFESYAKENIATLTESGNVMISGDNSQKYQGRLYAKRSADVATTVNTGQGTTFVSKNDDYVFEGIDGLRFFEFQAPASETSDSYYANIVDEGVSDVKVAVNCKDEGESISLDGTVYVAPLAGVHTYYFNPVYQDADGNVYAMSGSGLSGEMNVEGSAYSQNMKSNTTIVENGKKKTEDFSVNVNISVMFAPSKVKLLQMSKDHAVIAQTEYASDAVPDNFTPDNQTEYIVVENFCKNADGSERITHDVYDKGDKQMKTYHSLENGICVGKDTAITWE